jgi:PAS domain S-box-containing protein/putative nucleotidyltransferase with HDIG domain
VANLVRTSERSIGPQAVVGALFLVTAILVLAWNDYQLFARHLREMMAINVAFAMVIGLLTYRWSAERQTDVAAQRLQAAAARTSRDRRYRKIIENGWEVVVLLDADGRTSFVSAPALRVLGLEPREMTALPLSGFVHPEDRPLLMSKLEQVRTSTATTCQVELRMCRGSGEWMWVEFTATNHLAEADVAAVIVTLRDVTPQKLAEARAERLRRMYVVLMASNKAIVHAQSPGELMQRVCEVVVEHGHFALAWVGLVGAYVEGEAQTWSLSQCVAAQPESVDTFKRPLTGIIAADLGPIASIVLSGQRFVENDLRERSASCGLCRGANAAKFGAGAVLPLRVRGRTFALLGLFAANADVFDADEMRLLDELASDLASAVEVSLRHQEQRELQARTLQQEAALAESETRYRALFEASPQAMWIYEESSLALLLANPTALAYLGWTTAELNHMTLPDFLPPASRDALQAHLAKTGTLHETIWPMVRKSGETRMGRFVARSFTYEGRRAQFVLVQDVTDEEQRAHDRRVHGEQLRRAMLSTIRVVQALGELRDPYTHGHERRVGEIAASIAMEMGLDEEMVEGVRVAGYIHDIGKIGVPSEILAKPGRLSPTEMALIRQHPSAGYAILKELDFPWPVAQVTLQHHERMDGSGYPSGLTGEEIGLESRIVAVADTVEAMSSHRPYRPAVGLEAALEEIAMHRGTRYDPDVVDACLRLYREKYFVSPT